jgi:hypothetical protein
MRNIRKSCIQMILAIIFRTCSHEMLLHIEFICLFVYLPTYWFIELNVFETRLVSHLESRENQTQLCKDTLLSSSDEQLSSDHVTSNKNSNVSMDNIDRTVSTRNIAQEHHEMQSNTHIDMSISSSLSILNPEVATCTVLSTVDEPLLTNDKSSNDEIDVNPSSSSTGRLTTTASILSWIKLATIARDVKIHPNIFVCRSKMM